MNRIQRMFFAFGILAVAVFPFLTVAHAQQNTATTVEFVQVNGDGTIRFRTPHQLCTAASPSGGDRFHGDIAVGRGGVTAEGLRGMLTVLTSARLSGRTVTVYAVNGATNAYGCTVTALNLN